MLDLSVTLTRLDKINKDVNIVKPKSKVQSPKVKTKGTWADTIITSMKECSRKKVQKMKVAQNDPLDSPS